MEKALAQRSGLGWVGKNTLLITRTHGSWVVLGELFTELELEPDQPHPDLCRDCELCLSACPTDALIGVGRLDCRRCISYHTIERPADEASDLARAGNIFGCDICQEACPWNTQTHLTQLADFAMRENVLRLCRGQLPGDAQEWEQQTRGSSLRRITFDRLRDNAVSVDREKNCEH